MKASRGLLPSPGRADGRLMAKLGVHQLTGPLLVAGDVIDVLVG
jgi:hypothetical protein